MKTKTKQESAKTAGISEEAVRAKTGRTWKQWCQLLDKAGAKKLDHKGIVAYLAEHDPDLGGWWTQMVTVGYEQARGLREKHQKPGGYEISASKTVNVPVGKLFSAFQEAKVRKRWLADHPITIRKATKDKSMRITWSDEKTGLSVNFYAKGNGKSQVSLQHGKLPDAKTAEKMKTFWAKRLETLKGVLEGP